MQQVDHEKFNLVKLWKESFLRIDPFKYSSREILLEEKEDALGLYKEREPRDIAPLYLQQLLCLMFSMNVILP